MILKIKILNFLNKIIGIMQSLCRFRFLLRLAALIGVHFVLHTYSLEIFVKENQGR